MIGCSFVVDREYFGDIGLLDPGMEVYGGENIELGMRVSVTAWPPRPREGTVCQAGLLAWLVRKLRVTSKGDVRPPNLGQCKKPRWQRDWETL